MRVGSASGKRIDVTYASTSDNDPRDVPLYLAAEGAIVGFDGFEGDWNMTSSFDG